MGWLNLASSIGSYMIPKLAANTYKTPTTPTGGTRLAGPPAPSTWQNTASDWTQIGGTPTGGTTPTAGTTPTTTPTTGTTSTTGTASSYANADQYDSYLKGLEYGLPDVEQMSWDDALARAKSIYEPQYQASVLARDKMASDQRELLAQTMGARGYASGRGGKMESGQGDITQDQAIANQQTANMYDSNANQMAMNIYEGEAQRNESLMNAMIDQQNRQNANKLNVWGVKQSQSMQKDKDDSDEYQSTMAWLLKILGMDE
jgi:hypothetical protein